MRHSLRICLWILPWLVLLFSVHPRMAEAAWPPPEAPLANLTDESPTFLVYLPMVAYRYPPCPTLNPIPAPDADGFYTVTWQGVALPVDHYLLEQSRDAAFSSIEQTWVTTATAQTVGPVYCSCYYRVRADRADGWGAGPWSNVEQSIVPPPAPPVLNALPSRPKGQPYVVSWSPVGLPVEQYLLQESTASNFAAIRREWRVAGISQVISSSLSYDTLYYRVRAENHNCWGESAWSGVKPFYPSYFDDFSDPASGWPQEEVFIYRKEDPGDVRDVYYRFRYESGQYRFMLDQGGPPAWFRQPDALAPYRVTTDKYCVETSIRIMKAQPPYQRWDFYPYWANGGLIFGAREDDTQLYILCLAIGAGHSPGGPADMGWYIIRNPQNQWPYEGCHTSDPLGGQGIGLDTEVWHRFQVSVEDNRATVYIDGQSKGVYILDGLEQTSRVGVTAGSYEVTPVDFRFDDFLVVPNAGCVP